MYDDEEPKDGDRQEEEKENKPAKKKKRVQRLPKARPATKPKKRPREGQQLEGATDGKKQQPAKHQQQQPSKPRKTPKKPPSKAPKRAKAKDPQPSKSRYEVIVPKRARGAPSVLPKAQLKAIERLAGDAADEAEEDRIAELAHRPFYTHEGEKVGVPLNKGATSDELLLGIPCSALAQGPRACHLAMQSVATALGLLAARWGARLAGCCRTLCMLRKPKRVQQDMMLRGVPPFACPFKMSTAVLLCLFPHCTLWHSLVRLSQPAQC